MSHSPRLSSARTRAQCTKRFAAPRNLGTIQRISSCTKTVFLQISAQMTVSHDDREASAKGAESPQRCINIKGSAVSYEAHLTTVSLTKSLVVAGLRRCRSCVARFSIRTFKVVMSDMLSSLCSP